MNNPISDIIYRKLSSQVITPAEQDALNNWLHISQDNAELYAILNSEEGLRSELNKMLYFQQQQDNAFQRFEKQYGTTKAVHPESTSEPVRSIKMTWLKYAASIILIGGIVAFLWNLNNQHSSNETVSTLPIPAKDILPGGFRATLKLANGKTIILDTAANGMLSADEGNTIVKNGEEISYGQPRNAFTAYHTMSTPKGGQYRLKLSDGTIVWLNAASSITYPAAFNTKERTVSITGEAYFEVAPNSRAPFRITAGKSTVRVLGTHFNINAYSDEESINTTLLEGAVMVSAEGNSLVLAPGQQAQIQENNNNIRVIKNVDVNASVAWKNGAFAFRNADLREVMRQLTRWYNIEVEYKGKIPEGTFSGEIGRDLSLSQVLNGLTKTRINYKIENNNKLIILP